MRRPPRHRIVRTEVRCESPYSEAAEELGVEVVRVPAYSPHAVAEHTLALILALNRRIYRAHIASTTLQNVRDVEETGSSDNAVRAAEATAPPAA